MAGPLAIEWNPIDAPGVDDPAEAATWSELRIEVRDGPSRSVLTHVLDRHARSTRESVFDTVLPLAFFIARSWSHLFAVHHGRPSHRATRRERYEFERTHLLRMAGEGAAVPDLTIDRVSSSSMRLSWKKDEASEPWERVLFLSAGEAILPDHTVEAAFREFVTGVLERLRALAPDSWRTRDLAAIWTLREEPRSQAGRAERLCAELGRFWWEIDTEEREALQRLVDEPEASFIGPIGGMTCATNLSEIVRSARALLDLCDAAGAAPRDWKDARAALAQGTRAAPIIASAWRLGWERARRARDLLAGELDAPADLLSRWSSTSAGAGMGLSPERADALIAWRTGRAVVRVSMTASEVLSHRWERFAAARDLYPVLFGGSPASDSAFVLDRRVGGLGSEARAFATEIVAPLEAVQNELPSGDAVGDWEIEAIAAKLKAPSGCVRHQIQNHRLATILD